MIFSCFFAGFLLFHHKGSVTGCDSSLGSFYYSPVHFAFMYLHSLYYYYNYGCAEAIVAKMKFAIDRLYCVLLLLLKKVGSARLRVIYVHPISPKTPAPQYQPIDRKKRKGKAYRMPVGRLTETSPHIVTR